MPKDNLRQRTKVKRKRRQRRSTEEIIDLIIEAACDEFERNGYEGTKTASIALKAGVAEPLIFSNFGSKAQLFHDSIFKPLDRHLLQFCATHLVEVGDTEGFRKESREYILELQQFIGRHARMLSSLITAQMYASDKVHGLSQVEGLHNYFSRTEEMAWKQLTKKPKIDPKLLGRVSFATILACVVFKDWLFPKGLASEDEVSAAISDFILEGLNANAEARRKTQRSGRSPSVAGSKRKQ